MAVRWAESTVGSLASDWAVSTAAPMVLMMVEPKVVCLAGLTAVQMAA